MKEQANGISASAFLEVFYSVNKHEATVIKRFFLFVLSFKSHRQPARNSKPRLLLFSHSVSYVIKAGPANTELITQVFKGNLQNWQVLKGNPKIEIWMGLYCVARKQRGTSFRAGPLSFSRTTTNWTQPVHPAQRRLHHLGRAKSPTAILVEERNRCRRWKTVRLVRVLMVVENKSSKQNEMEKPRIPRIRRALKISL